MVKEAPWARHYQTEWQSRAGDRRLPHWLRVAALAYGSHQDNGHARFKRGEIALILGEIDKETGEVRPYANVGRAIRDAVSYGWLERDSFWGCLVVPAHAIKKGRHGHSPECPIHLKRRRKEAANPSLSDGFGTSSSTLSERFSTRTAHSVTGSQRAPLSLISHTAPPGAEPPEEAIA